VVDSVAGTVVVGSVAGTAEGSVAASSEVWTAFVSCVGLASMSGAVCVRAGAAASSTMASVATSNVGLFI
jgi:hypothetical protein